MLKGEQHIDYFNIYCQDCGEQTKNKYLGWDPAVPHFRAVCPNCGDLGTVKFSAAFWTGLPTKPN